MIDAKAAVERIVAFVAEKLVATAVAGDEIAEFVAGSIDVGGTGQSQVLHIVGENDTVQVVCTRSIPPLAASVTSSSGLSIT